MSEDAKGIADAQLQVLKDEIKLKNLDNEFTLRHCWVKKDS